MSLYAMADFHLSIGINDKPMDVFGGNWDNYMEKIKQNCQSILCNDDMLLIAGDISWATYLPDALDDLKFIDSLPGKKIISKGNHDYWWTGISKLNTFLRENNITSISFLHNNYYEYNGVAICGNRGWTNGGSDEDKKISNREQIRLELSLSEAEKAGFSRKIVMTHFPPVSSAEDEFALLLEKYNVSHCVYGHLHNVSKTTPADYVIGGVKYILTSSDYLNFIPYKIF